VVASCRSHPSVPCFMHRPSAHIAAQGAIASRSGATPTATSQLQFNAALPTSATAPTASQVRRPPRENELNGLGSPDLVTKVDLVRAFMASFRKRTGEGILIPALGRFGGLELHWRLVTMSSDPLGLWLHVSQIREPGLTRVALGSRVASPLRPKGLNRFDPACVPSFRLVIGPGATKARRPIVEPRGSSHVTRAHQ
jgi:hypothetical protein